MVRLMVVTMLGVLAVGCGGDDGDDVTLEAAIVAEFPDLAESNREELAELVRGNCTEMDDGAFGIMLSMFAEENPSMVDLYRVECPDRMPDDQ